MNILKNKQGTGYPFICVVILTVVMLISVALGYAYVHHVAHEQKAEIQTTVDSYITKYAIDSYQAIKKGTVYGNYITYNEMIDGIYEELGFSPNSSENIWILSYNGKCRMSKPNVETISDMAFGTKIHYKVVIPFEALGIKIADITIPIEIIGCYAER